MKSVTLVEEEEEAEEEQKKKKRKKFIARDCRYDLLQKEVREVFPECGHLSPSRDRVARWKILAGVLLTGLKARATEKTTEPLEFPPGYPLDVCRG